MGLLPLMLGVLGFTVLLSSLFLTTLVRRQAAHQKRSEAYIEVAKYLGENPTLFKMLEFRHKKLLASPLSNISLVENTAGEKRWILSKILLMIGTAILTTWLQLVAQ